jgi:hypothetical protein
MNLSTLLKSSSVLWIIWGIVHIVFGVFVIYLDAGAAIQEIANGAMIPKLEYSPEANAVMNQHGWNLIWFGTVTIIGGVLIWKENKTAIWVSAMVGGLADLGYFIFMDLGGFVKFFPGTLMTIIALAAIILGFMANKKLSNQ